MLVYEPLVKRREKICDQVDILFVKFNRNYLFIYFFYANGSFSFLVLCQNWLLWGKSNHLCKGKDVTLIPYAAYYLLK